MCLLGRLLQLIVQAVGRMVRFFKACIHFLQARRKRRDSEGHQMLTLTASKGTQTAPEAQRTMELGKEPRPERGTGLKLQIPMKRRPAFCRGVPNLKSIDNVLPPEILALISEYLPTADLYSFREISRRCSNAAHTLFCRTIDQRSFPITCKELKKLDRMLQNTECGGYMTTLRIDTQVACQCQTFGYASWIGWKRPGSLSSAVFACFPRNKHDSSKCANALKKVLQQMPNLTSIVLVDAGVRVSQAAVAVGGFIEPPVSGPIEPCSTVERWATWRALNLLVQAFDVNSLQGTELLPFPTKLALDGPFPVEALPGNTLATSNSCLFDHLTSVSLTIADTEMDPLNLRLSQPDRCLPEFLRLLPPTLRDIAIAFPRDTYNERIFFQGPRPIQPLFGDFGFEAILTPDSIYFPQLSTLHLTNLSLGDYQSLKRFLQLHAATLGSLRLTDLALTGADWRPFIKSLKDNLKLEKFELDTKLTEREKAVDIFIWEATPANQRLRRLDYEGASKDTWVNGVKVGQVSSGKKEQEGGYEADEEDEGEAWAA